jgi:hypothetical protein
MTFWSTLYYSGYVVISIAGGTTLEQCQESTYRIMSDIDIAYVSPDPNLLTGPFPTHEFTIDCTRERMKTDERYMND